MHRVVSIVIIMITFSSVCQANDDWIVGKWRLSYDPDDASTDYLEFRDNGDAYSHGPLGTLEGMYLVSEDRVRAVFSYKGKDVIMTFFFTPDREQLKIVTSHTGRASVYTKLPAQTSIPDPDSTR